MASVSAVKLWMRCGRLVQPLGLIGSTLCAPGRGSCERWSGWARPIRLKYSKIMRIECEYQKHSDICARQSTGPHASRTHLKLCPVGTMTPSFVLWQSDSVRGRRVSCLSLAQFDSGMKSVPRRGGVSPPCLGRAGRTALRATLFKWETKRRENKIVRCPYCVEGGEFKVMAQQGADEWFICASCGHLALPSNWLFECTCLKCERPGRNATNRSEPRALVGG